MRPSFLECGRCARTHDASVPQTLCAACGKPLLARYDLEAAAPSMRPGGLRRSDLWRYLPVLPVAEESQIVTLGEGWTPLLECAPLARWAGLRRCLVKDEAGNPTGSFKARGMAVATAAARALGISTVFVPSAGNAAGALAAYAARAGMRATVAMPEDAPAPNLLECRAAGAETVLVRGTIADAAAVLRARFRGSEAFDLSTMREP
ncbi:MAG: pyridoxal-phosphate dependent enzyme, partial [Planctomycetota bacterium]